MVLHHRSTNVADHHDDLIGGVSPPPDALVVRVIGLDERVVRHALVFEVPLVFGGPAGQRLHLDEDHPLVPAREARDDRLVKVDPLRHLIRRRLPLAVPAAEVQAELSPIDGIEGGRDVDFVVEGDATPDLAAQGAAEERRFNLELDHVEGRQRQEGDEPQDGRIGRRRRELRPRPTLPLLRRRGLPPVVGSGGTQVDGGDRDRLVRVAGARVHREEGGR
mmetsp:Transcript_58723/g.124680  ORF Transcript_58723/g.124680 Transcript_58723/m.124680 type:complete len:220 (-) Transcript_58723:109-768(-)